MSKPSVVEVGSLRKSFSYDTVTVKIGDGTVTARVADTQEKRYTGLSDTDELGKDEGMLFLYDREAPHELVMRDMDFPLDVVHVDSDNRVVRYDSMTDDGEGVMGVSKFAIELPHGWCVKHDVSLGDTVTIEAPEERKEKLFKGRRYIDDPSDAPDDAEVQEGPQGGLYYETEGTAAESEEDTTPEESTVEVSGFEVGWEKDIPPLESGSTITYTRGGGRERTGTVKYMSVLFNGQPAIVVEEEKHLGSGTFSRTLTRTEDGEWQDLHNKDTVEIDTAETETGVPDESAVSDQYAEWSEETAHEWSELDSKDSRGLWHPEKVPFDEISPGDQVRVTHPALGADMNNLGDYYGNTVEATVLSGSDSRVVIDVDGERMTVAKKAVEEVKRRPDEEAEFDPVDFDSVELDSAFDELPDDVRSGRLSNIDNLRGVYDDNVVNYVESLMKSWGVFDYSNESFAEFWATAAKLKGEEVPEKYRDELDTVFDADVYRAMADKMRMDRKAAKEAYGDSKTLYRGIHPRTIEKYGEVTDEGVTIDPNVMESWTQKHSLADDFGGVVLKKEWETDKVGFFRSDELTLVGHETYTIPHENIEGDLDG